MIFALFCVLEPLTVKIAHLVRSMGDVVGTESEGQDNDNHSNGNFHTPRSSGWSDVQTIPLSFHQHRGHDEDHHPMNLLLNDSSSYRSASWEPALGDWIVFKIDTPLMVIPEAISIRNSSDISGLKFIELSLGSDDDDECEGLRLNSIGMIQRGEDQGEKSLEAFFFSDSFSFSCPRG